MTIVGAVFPGYEWYEAELREQVRNLGLEGSVTFCGFVPDVWPVLETLDVIAVPSRYDEPFGNTAVEAVLAGRPVVVSATSGWSRRSAAIVWRFPSLRASGAAGGRGAESQGQREALRAAAESDFALATRRHSAAAYGARIVLVVGRSGRRSARGEPAPLRDRSPHDASGVIAGTHVTSKKEMHDGHDVIDGDRETA